MTGARRSGNSLTRILDAITRFVGRAVAWLIVPMVASLVYEVIARYVFDAPTLWAYDMTYMLYGTFFMLGSSAGFTYVSANGPMPCTCTMHSVFAMA